MKKPRLISRTATIAGTGGLHAIWAWEHRGITAWGAAEPGMTANEAEEMALWQLVRANRPGVRRVRSRWSHRGPLTTIQNREAADNLASLITSRDTYRSWRNAGIRIACDASYDPVRKRGAWGYARAGTKHVTIDMGDARNSMLCELRAAHAALKATPRGASVELLIDYRPLALVIADLGRDLEVRSWPSLRHCEETRAVFSELRVLVHHRRVSATWVPGHGGHTLFRRIDQATRAAMRGERRAATGC